MKRRITVAEIAFVAWWVSVCVAAASDWTGFLGGPYRTASADDKGLLPTWSTNGPPLLWATNGIGKSFGEVLVVGNDLFAAGTTGRHTNTLQCLDVATGTRRWSVNAPHAGGDATPAWDAGRIYLQSRGQIGCYDAKNGAPVWQANPADILKQSGVSPAKITTPCYSGPWVQSLLAHQGTVLIVLGQPRGLVVALDGITGKTRWISQGEKTASGLSWSSASLVRCGKRDIVVAPTTGDLVGLDFLTGKVLWEERVYPPTPSANGYLYTWACPPACAEGLLFAFGGYRDMDWTTFQLAPDGSGVRRAWNRIRIHPNQENVIVVDGVLYGSGSVYPADLDENPGFLLDGKSLQDLPGGVVQKWREQAKKNPDKPRPLPLAQVSPGTTLVCQDLKTGKVLGARGVGNVQGHSYHMLTYAEGRLYVLMSGGGPMRST